MPAESKKIKKAILSLLNQNNEYDSSKKLRKAVKHQLAVDSDAKLNKEDFKSTLARLIEKGTVSINGKRITIAEVSINKDNVVEIQYNKRKRSNSNEIHEKQHEEDEAQAEEDRIINIAHGLVPIPNTNNSSSSSVKSYENVNAPVEVGTATILLFYAYCEPIMTRSEQDNAIAYCYSLLSSNGITGRLRVGREGFNGTLTGQHDAIRIFTSSLRTQYPHIFGQTDFKYVDRQPSNQLLKNLKVWPVTEIVTYGFDPKLAPLEMTGTHLSPRAFHEAMADPRSVVIDVRNFNETLIGKFAPPAISSNDTIGLNNTNNSSHDDHSTTNNNDSNNKKKNKKNKDTQNDNNDVSSIDNSSDNNSSTTAMTSSEKVLDPLMRRSTEFPDWVAKNRHKLEGKKVLMYCTGGVRCERASAYIRNLGIEDVSQLEGGIHRYLEAYSEDGGYWVGKNYTFDRRFSHGAAKCDVISHCVHCSQPWDRYQAGAKCAICAMEVLLCKTCDRLKPKVKKASLRCPLCVTGHTTPKNVKYLGKGSKIADDG